MSWATRNTDGSMLRPEGATAFKKHCWSEGISWVDFMNTAVLIVVYQKLPIDVRVGILKTDTWEETVRGMSNPE